MPFELLHFKVCIALSDTESWAVLEYTLKQSVKDRAQGAITLHYIYINSFIESVLH